MSRALRISYRRVVRLQRIEISIQLKAKTHELRFIGEVLTTKRADTSGYSRGREKN